MSARLRLTRAARDLAPLQQGELDSLCGLYAIINGIRVAVYPGYEFDKRVLHRLFIHGTVQLSRFRKLRDAIAGGMDETLLLRVCSAVAAEVAHLSGHHLYSSGVAEPGQPWNTRGAVQRIKHCLQQGEPVFLALEGKLDHWTVVVGYSATRLYLFDSAGYRWVLIKSITASSGPLRKLYRITSASTVVLKTAP